MLLDTILYNLKSNPNKICCKHDKEYTNKEFYEIVCKVYELIKDAPKDKPIVVYGHKEVYMIASFLACSFLGIAYVPIDKMMSKERVKFIIDSVNPSFIIGDCSVNGDYKTISFNQIEEYYNYEDIVRIDMKPEDVYYILFTSGTSGNPKGVMVTYENIDSCVKWLKRISGLESHIDNYTIYNQAVFSFDLSVADIYLSLATGSNHYIGEDISILKFQKLYDDLKTSNSNMMILTPSSAELMATDYQFNQTLMPHLNQILFCGERLTHKLVDKLYQRFPDIKIINSYGPTEATFAVTSIDIPKDYKDIIPIGYPKDDVEILIVDNMIPKSEGEVGEILITGKSVAKGYLDDNNNSKFIMYNGKKGYLTGDLGFYKDNKLYFVSRKDTQVKYKGYRIELSDIENNILSIDGVRNCKVKAEKSDNEEVKRIIAYIVLEENADASKIKESISNKLPQYMIPTLQFVDSLSLTLNGKSEI